jgi:mRNA interferase RelE/StbE
MAFTITLMPKAIKALEKINEPYYSNIKTAIYSLSDNPRPNGYRKLKGDLATGCELRITELFTV